MRFVLPLTVLSLSALGVCPQLVAAGLVAVRDERQAGLLRARLPQQGATIITGGTGADSFTGDTADNIAVSGDERSPLELSGVGFFPPPNVTIGCTGHKTSSLGGKAESVE